MPVRFYDPLPQFLDDNGNPISNGIVAWYDAGTENLKAVYLDSALTTPATNPMSLDAGGFVTDSGSGVFLGTGTYDFVVMTSASAVERTTSAISGGEAAVSGISTMAVVDTIADMQALDVDVYDAAYVQGYFNKGDLGGGHFYLDSGASGTPDGGSFFSPDAGLGRWYRIFDHATTYPQQWGAMTGNSYDIVSQVEAMVEWCKADDQVKKIRFPGGDYYMGVTGITIDGDVELELDEDVQFRHITMSATPVNITCTKATINGLTTKIDPLSYDYIELTIQPAESIDVRPEWWGAPVDGTSDCADAFDRMQNFIDITRCRLLLNAQYTITTAGSIIPGGWSLPELVKEEDTACIKLDESGSMTVAGVAKYPLTAAEENDRIFRGTYQENIKTRTREYHAHWYDITDASGNIDEAVLVKVFEAATQAGTVEGTVVFDARRTYTIASTISHNYEEELSCDFQNGTTLVCNAASLEFGTILTGPAQFVDEDSTGSLKILNQQILPQWFGATGTSSSTTAVMNKNVKALKLAGTCLAAIGGNSVERHYIDGLGAVFYLNAEITYSGSDTFALQNVTLQSNNFASSYILNISGGEVSLNRVVLVANGSTKGGISFSSGERLELNNCDIVATGDSINISSGSSLDINGGIYTGDIVSTDSTVPRIIGINLTGDLTISADPGNVTIEGNAISGTVTIGATAGTFGGTICGNRGIGYMNLTGTKQLVVDGNNVDKLRFDEFEDIVVTNNVMTLGSYPFFIFTNDAGSHIAKMIVKGNVLTYTGGGTADAMTISNMALTAHFAVVKDNYASSNIIMPSTEPVGITDNPAKGVVDLRAVCFPGDISGTDNPTSVGSWQTPVTSTLTTSASSYFRCTTDQSGNYANGDWLIAEGTPGQDGLYQVTSVSGVGSIDINVTPDPGIGATSGTLVPAIAMSSTPYTRYIFGAGNDNSSRIY